jgi:hypothetical protein
LCEICISFVEFKVWNDMYKAVNGVYLKRLTEAHSFFRTRLYKSMIGLVFQVVLSPSGFQSRVSQKQVLHSCTAFRSQSNRVRSSFQELPFSLSLSLSI